VDDTTVAPPQSSQTYTLLFCDGGTMAVVSLRQDEPPINSIFEWDGTWWRALGNGRARYAGLQPEPPPRLQADVIGRWVLTEAGLQWVESKEDAPC
jgi:hypothetical protein